MTERVMIFLIVASTIAAVTLIGGIVAIVKSIADAKACEYTAESLSVLRELNCDPRKVFGEDYES